MTRRRVICDGCGADVTGGTGSIEDGGCPFCAGPLAVYKRETPIPGARR